MLSKPDSALLIVAHGSTLNPDSSAPTFMHSRTIREQGIFREVCCAFWKEEPSFRQVLHMIDAKEIYIVPNFISEGYFTRTVIPRELELTGADTRRDGKSLKYCDPVGCHPHMTDLLLKRAQEVAPNVDPNETTLLIVGHGTNLNDNSSAAAAREAELIRARGIFAEVLCTYMEEAPLIADWKQFATQPNIVVLPFFISDGLHSFQDIPVLLGIETEIGPAASQRNISRFNPHSVNGHHLYYANAVGTDPRFAALILDQVSAFDASHPEYP